MTEDEKYEGPERRQLFRLSDSQIEIIAERAAEVALEKVYVGIGKSVVHKVLWVIGAGALALLVWLKSDFFPHK